MNKKNYRSTSPAAATVLLSLLFGSCAENVLSFTPMRLPPQLRQHSPPLFVSNIRDADFIEMMVGGERYEMVPLPDSMVDTTCFVGNLCEFIKDDDLSDLFKCVSHLQSVPACVARKPNTNSLQYGFVSFPSVAEKEAAIIKFNGYKLNGRRIKVEPILDNANFKRVKVPERLVAYMCGEAKKTSDGRVNTLRRVSREEVDRMSKHKHSSSKKSKGRNKQAAASAAAALPYSAGIRLNEAERNSLERAAKQGFVSLSGTAYRRGRKGSALANAHRLWSDARGKPQIILCKASGGRPLDHLIVDLSPLRIHGLFDDSQAADDLLISWKTQILLAAIQAGMELRDDYEEDNTIGLELDYGVEIEPEIVREYSITFDSNSWAAESILNLPAVSLGVFEGERSKAKAMAKGLAALWDIPEPDAPRDDHGERPQGYKKSGGNKKNRGGGKSLSKHRRRSRNPYNALEM